MVAGVPKLISEIFSAPLSFGWYNFLFTVHSIQFVFLWYSIPINKARSVFRSSGFCPTSIMASDFWGSYLSSILVHCGLLLRISGLGSRYPLSCNQSWWRALGCMDDGSSLHGRVDCAGANFIGFGGLRTPESSLRLRPLICVLGLVQYFIWCFGY